MKTSELICLIEDAEQGGDSVTVESGYAARVELEAMQARITELEKALGDARIALTFYREWMDRRSQTNHERYPFGIEAEDTARRVLKG